MSPQPKKPLLLLFSILLAVSLFLLLAWGFVSMRGYFVKQFAAPAQYWQPSPEDSLYMDLLARTDSRPKAVAIARRLQPFYFWADSSRTVLHSQLSDELIRTTLLHSGMADSLHAQFLRLADSDFACRPPCLPPRLRDVSAWRAFVASQSPEALDAYILNRVRQARSAERTALSNLE